MSNNLPTKTTDIEIRRPELWTLHLALNAQRISYVLYSKAQDDSLIWGEVGIDLSFGSYLKGVENAIYDNPLFLKPYGEVKVVVDSTRFMVMPSEIDDDDTRLDVMDTAFPDAEGEFAFCGMPQCGTVMGFEMEKGLEAFLQRTFFNPPICHALVPLCEYHKSKQGQTSLRRMYAHLHDDKLSLCLFQRGDLAMTNSFKFETIDDAAYYALHAWQSYGFDALADEIQLSGDKSLRDDITPMLRKYVNYVMPAIFPAAAMRIGHDAVKAPYHLILLALCE